MVLTKKDLTEALLEMKKGLLLETRRDLTEALQKNKKDLLLETRKDLAEALQITKKDLLLETRKNLTQALLETKNELLQVIDQKLDQKVDSLRVLIEDVRSDLKFALEVRDPHEEKLQNHDQILKKHETRITTLEDYTYTKDRLKS